MKELMIDASQVTEWIAKNEENLTEEEIKEEEVPDMEGIIVGSNSKLDFSMNYSNVKLWTLAWRVDSSIIFNVYCACLW